MTQPIVVTGASGLLGRELLPRLTADGFEVRAVSRTRQGPDGAVEWVRADLETGMGVAEAVAGADTIVHLAHDPKRRPEAVNVAGTRTLLRLVREAGVSHVFYLSIVGIDRVPGRYYRTKLAAEGLVGESGIPWTILRATQVHSFLDKLLRGPPRVPLLPFPTDYLLQPVDAGDVATRLRDALVARPAGRLPDMGGPEIHRLGDLTSSWLDTQGRRTRLLRLPPPGKTAAAVRRGEATTPEHRDGVLTWAEWLHRTYGSAAGAGSRRLPTSLPNRVHRSGNPHSA